MTNNKDCRINGRLTQSQLKWYREFALLEGVHVSNLLSLIPEMYDKMDRENDKLRNEVKELKEELIELERDNDKLLGDWIAK